MNKKAVTFILIALFLSNSSIALDCRSMEIGITRKNHYDNADKVFYGTLIKSQNRTAVFHIIEQFKGETNTNPMIIVNFPYLIDSNLIFTTWLLYCNSSKNSDTLFVSECSISRSYLNSRINASHSPPVIFQNSDMNNLAMQLSSIKWSLDFNEELIVLRTMNSTYSENNQILKKYDFDNLYIYVVLVLILLFVLIIKKKRN